MATSATTSLLAAEPEPVELDWAATALLIIDMQRDFLEPGGFGETLGNDVSQLARAVAPCAKVLAAARDAGILVVHTRICLTCPMRRRRRSSAARRASASAIPARWGGS
jgi:nicotinamidase-related amidase